MRSRSSRTRLIVSLAPLACASAFLVLAGACKKPDPAPVQNTAPPPVVVDAAPMQLVPISEDAGITIDAAPPPVAHHASGGGLTNNQARAKQCCNALRAAGKSDPMLTAFAAQCDMVAMQMGPTSGGQAPEFAGIRNLLKGHNIPAVCSGL
jgi:hypothetical protein